MAIKDDILGFTFFGQDLEVVGGSQCPRFVIVINIVALVDRGFILIVSTGREFAAADPADIPVGLDGINKDIVGMVAVVFCTLGGP